MSKIMTANQLVAKAIDIAKNYKTLYVMGAFGAPLTAANKERYCKNHEYNRRPARQELIRAASSDTFAFDCVNLLKGILWSWSGDLNAPYGGATYASNGVPDIDADQMINRCSEVSANFASIKPGEMLWKSGHAGIYIGDGLGVECTPAWYDKVQITAVGNIGRVSGYNVRQWSRHGKLPWVDYTAKEEEKPMPSEEEIEQIVQRFLDQQFHERWLREYNAKMKELSDNDSGRWSEEARQWAVENGLIQGVGTFPDGTTNYAWQQPLTREQYATVEFRQAMREDGEPDD
jgi:hypothetical protein